MLGPPGEGDPAAAARAVAVSPDGRLAAATVGGTAYADPAKRAWGLVVVEAETGRVVRWTRAPGAAPDRLAFSPDGRWVARPDRVWDVATLAEVRRLAGEDGATALAFSPDLRRLAAGRADGTAVVWPVGE